MRAFYFTDEQLRRALEDWVTAKVRSKGEADRASHQAVADAVNYVFQSGIVRGFEVQELDLTGAVVRRAIGWCRDLVARAKRPARIRP